MNAPWLELPPPARLPAPRRAALEDFLSQGLPGPRQEDWRYTPLDHLSRQALHPPRDDAETALIPEDYPGALLAFLDDRLIWQDTGLPPEVLGSLADAGDLPVYSLLGTLAGTGALAQLNRALWRDGALLHVPRGVRLRQPVFLRFATGQAGALLHPRVLVRIGAHADAILVEHYLGDTQAPYWRNGVTEVSLEPGARLTHIRILDEGDEATHTGLTAVRQDRDSAYRCLDLSLGGRVCRHELQVHLAGEGARARLDGLFVADGRRHADLHLRVEHAAHHTESATLYRGMAAGRGRGVFDARAVVRPGVSGADARQSSRNLLLSPHAEIDAKPQLEIHADQVKASHGATVGRLDPDALFYLQSRGIAPDEARRLLLAAFANEALGLLEDAGLRDWLAPTLARRLPTRPTGEARP